MQDEKDEFIKLRRTLERNKRADERARKERKRYSREHCKKAFAALPNTNKKIFYDRTIEWIEAELLRHPNNLGLLFLDRISSYLNQEDLVCYIGRISALDKCEVLQDSDIVNVIKEQDVNLSNKICKTLKSEIEGASTEIRDLAKRDVLQSFRKASKLGLLLATGGFVANNVSSHPIIPDGIIPATALAGIGGYFGTNSTARTRDIPLERIGRAVKAQLELLECEGQAR